MSCSNYCGVDGTTTVRPTDECATGPMGMGKRGKECDECFFCFSFVFRGISVGNF